MQPLRIETAGAVTDELHRHGVDAGESGELVRRHRGEPSIERGRQIVPDVARCRRDGVEVVEQPFGRGGRSLATANVVGQGHVHVAQRLHVPVEALQMRAITNASPGRHRQQCRETSGVFFERLDAQQFQAAVHRRMHAGDLTD